MNGTVDHRREVGAHEQAALVTVETAERLALAASKAITAGETEKAQRLLVALVRETTLRTCTAVKSQELSDRIADAARVIVGGEVAIINAQLQQEAEAEPAEPKYYDREAILRRFSEADEFVIELGPNDTAWDPETGDTLLGGHSVRFHRGEFPGPPRLATLLD